MFFVEKTEQLADKVYQMWVRAPHVSHHAQAGQFVIFRIDEKGERIPLTISATDGDIIRSVHVSYFYGRAVSAYKTGKHYASILTASQPYIFVPSGE